MFKVNEIFSSIQGEGSLVGYPVTFVRFSGCPNTCSFCDTDHEQYEELSTDQIVERIKKVAPLFHADKVVFTGGEPLMQINRELVDAVNREYTYGIALETSGIGNAEAIAALSDIWHVVLSPKNDDVPDDVINHCDELKILVPVGFNGLSIAFIDHCIQYMPVSASIVIQPIAPKGDSIVDSIKLISQHEAIPLFKALQRTYPSRKIRIIPQVHRLVGWK